MGRYAKHCRWGAVAAATMLLVLLVVATRYLRITKSSYERPILVDTRLIDEIMRDGSLEEIQQLAEENLQLLQAQPGFEAPVVYAVVAERYDVLDLLLRCDLATDASVNRDGLKAALSTAIEVGDLEAVRVLLRYDDSESTINTAIEQADCFQRHDIAKFLREHAS